MQRLGQGTKLSKTPNKPYLREKFFKIKSKYRGTCKKEKRKFEQSKLQKLDFWNLLMKGNNIDKQFSDEVLLPIQDLSKHYKELSQKKHNPTMK